MEPEEQLGTWDMSLGNSSASSSPGPVSAAANSPETPGFDPASTTMSQSLSSDLQDEGHREVTTPMSPDRLSMSPLEAPVNDHDLQECIATEDLVKNGDMDDFPLMEDEDLTGSNNNSVQTLDNVITIVDEEGMFGMGGEGEVDVNMEISFSQLMENCSQVELESIFNINMTATELEEHSKELATNAAWVTNMSTLGWKEPPPHPPEAPHMKWSEKQLHPLTPSVLVESPKDAFSPELSQFCMKNQIAVVRGLNSALKMDLGVFSTKTLVEANPQHPIDVRQQYLQSVDENLDLYGNKSWECYSKKSHSTVKTYAKYQASSFHQFMNDQNKSSSGNLKNKRKKMIKFGTNLDLADDQKWEEQLLELQKLPPFARVYSPGNMLSYVGYDILGMNTIQMYLKVPGSRTPGHQENNNFCSVNVNIGPGDCEWFAVADAYWGAIQRLCEKNNIKYLQGSWWPDPKDCEEAGIPVHRFTQRPGDFVWVNCGCVHWVQALGFCNNVAWNVGPLKARQYQMGIERYEWNKLQNFKSIVPMIHLSWNLARALFITDPNLFQLIKKTLMRTLVQCFKLLDFARDKGIEVRFQGEQNTALYCGSCLVEVFNVFFVEDKRKRPFAQCIDCALKISPNLQGFVCLEERTMEELKKVYDNFVFHEVVPTLPPVAEPPAAPETAGTKHSSARGGSIGK